MELALTIELVPGSCWYSNVRSNVKPATWERLQRATFMLCHNRCECCGRFTNLECHEVWHYDDRTQIQKLERLCGLCPQCHEVKHFGLATENGRSAPALKWFCEVNKMAPADAIQYIERAFKIHGIRSQFNWGLDVRYLEKSGVRLDKFGREIGV